jgi:hypothetical protein
MLPFMQKYLEYFRIKQITTAAEDLSHASFLSKLVYIVVSVRLNPTSYAMKKTFSRFIAMLLF